jgi:hypothetical protein
MTDNELTITMHFCDLFYGPIHISDYMYNVECRIIGE